MHKLIIGETLGGETTPGGYFEARSAIVADPAATYWLRDAVVGLEKRDPIDALKDAETLALLAQLRAKEILAQGK